jgi:hypothetical protein
MDKLGARAFLLQLDVHFLDEGHGFCICEIEKDAVRVHGNISPFFGSFAGYIYKQEVLVAFGVRYDAVALEFARVEPPALLHFHLDECSFLARFLFQGFVPNGRFPEKAEEPQPDQKSTQPT